MWLLLLLVACGDASSGAGASSLPSVDASTGASSGAPAAITGLPAQAWTWVPFPASQCRDGSSTGIGINMNPNSDRLMIFLEGGGACFNAITCSGNPSSFGVADFSALSGAHCNSAVGHGCGSINDGIFDRASAANPVRDWSYVYVPYCTGDVHGGNRHDVTITGVIDDAGTPQPQQFVGYANVGRYLERLAPTFPKLSRILLAGVSAGGFGVVNVYTQVTGAFGTTPVDLIDDSGPPMQDPYLATCQQAGEGILWGFGGTILSDCGADCSTPSSALLDYTRHIVKAHPGAAFGLVSSMDDNTITNEYGFGYQNCSGFQQLSSDQFSAGLNDIREKLAPLPNFGAFLFAGNAHVSLQNGAFFTRVAGGADARPEAGSGVLLTDWVSVVVGGSVSNAGP